MLLSKSFSWVSVVRKKDSFILSRVLLAALRLTADNRRGQEPADEAAVSHWQARARQHGARAEPHRARERNAGERPHHTEATAAGVFVVVSRLQVGRRTAWEFFASQYRQQTEHSMTNVRVIRMW